MLPIFPIYGLLAHQSDAHAPTALELALPSMQRLRPGLWVSKLAPGLWVTSFTHRMDDGTVYPANGLLVASDTATILVDPGWEPAQTRALIAWAKRVTGRSVTRALITHSHADRSAGVAVLNELGIPCSGLDLTRQRLIARGLPTVEALPGPGPWRIAKDIEVRYPGPGHAPDNAVVWIPKHKLLYGGCLLKSTTASSLGNLEDASIPQWPLALRQLREAYPEIRIQVPGHGALAGDAIAHTEALLTKALATEQP
jgi:glyoxylase-like metal-dependent hydrolase (beta-lactamase superfamily II)